MLRIEWLSYCLARKRNSKREGCERVWSFRHGLNISWAYGLLQLLTQCVLNEHCCQVAEYPMIRQLIGFVSQLYRVVYMITTLTVHTYVRIKFIVFAKIRDYFKSMFLPCKYVTLANNIQPEPMENKQHEGVRDCCWFLKFLFQNNFVYLLSSTRMKILFTRYFMPST